MKLLNQSISLISIALLAIVGIWGILFYYQLTNEIKKNVDEDIDNYRQQIIYIAHQDTVLLKKIDFNEGFYAIQEITKKEALIIKDTYSDTSMYISKGHDYQELEPYRMLSTAFEDDGHYYKLRIIKSIVEKEKLINEISRNLIFLYITLIISIIVINNLILRKVWRPFYNLLDQLKRYHIGKNDLLPSVKTSTREFKDLQEAIQTLLEHSRSSFEQQKQFIGNASHELQTPLAISLNKLELLIENDDLNEAQSQEIGETMEIIQRLIRLNKSLLLLSKIENRQFFNNQKVSFNAIIKKGVDELEDIANYKSIVFKTIENNEIEKVIDPALAEILINNLLRNAVFHNKNSTVEITINSQQIKIQNKGTEALNHKTIFNRFQKFNTNQQSSGLGLSIVLAICELYNYKINYDFINQNHQFTIDFK